MKNILFYFYVIFINFIDYLICYPKKVSKELDNNFFTKNKTIFYIDNLQVIYYNFDIDKRRELIIYCHGNRRNIFSRNLNNFINHIYKLQYDIIIFDYTGFGNSLLNKNSFTENEMIANTISIISYFINKNRSIILYGHSLGASIAISTCLKVPFIKELYIEAPFYNLENIVENYYENIVLKIITKYILFLFTNKYRNNENIKLIDKKIPITFIHSIDDKLIPFWHSIKLSFLVNNCKKIIYLTGTHGQPNYSNLCI